MPGVSFSRVAQQQRHLLQGQTNCTILVRGHRAFMAGRYPLKVVRDATSYYVEGFMFSPAYRRRIWDGKKHFFDVKTSSLPAGLATTVEAALREYDPTGVVRLVDETLAQMPITGNHGFDLHGIQFGVGAFDYQLAAANSLVRGRRGVLKIATNGGKTEISIAVTKHLALPTLFLVDGISLLTQTRKRYAKRLGIQEDEIGLIGDSKFSIGPWITIATPDSLGPRMALPEVQEALGRWQVVWFDECHHVAAETFYDVASAIPAYYRFGLSGTPLDRADGADLRLLACTGPVLYEVPNKLLIERGISVQPFVEMIKVHSPILPAKGVTWSQVEAAGVVGNPYINEAAAAKAIEHGSAGKQVLILVEKKKQAKLIMELLAGKAESTTDWLANRKKHKLKVEFLSGPDSGEAREQALDRFRAGATRIIVATTILDEGVDVPNIDVLILAAGGKGKIRLLQRVGRGLRVGVGKNKLLIIDFANFCHPWLLQHSLARLRTYKAEECFMISAA